MLNWSAKEGIKAYWKAKKLNPKITQEQALGIATAARKSALTESQTLGRQIHAAAKNHHDKQFIELEEDYKPYFEAYLRFVEKHNIQSLKQEEKVENHQLGYAGRFDHYCLFDGVKTLLDYKTGKSLRWYHGIQLEGYAEPLRRRGFDVDQKLVIHFDRKTRGWANPIECEVISYDTPYKSVESLMHAFHEKLHEVKKLKFYKIDWYERTDDEAIKKELEENSTSSESAPQSDVQGLPSGILDIVSSNSATPMGSPGLVLQPSYLYQEGKLPPLLSPESFPLVEDLLTTRRERQQEAPTDETSSHRTVIPLDKQSGVVRFDSSSPKSRTILKPLKRPSAKDTSHHPDEIELSSQRLRRLGIDV